jgi:hypothetical protein
MEDKMRSDAVLKKIRRQTFFVLAVGFTLYTAVLVPLYVQLSANVVYQNSFVCWLLYYAYNAVDLLAFFWVYAATAYTMYRGGFKSCGGLFGLYGGLILYKYVANYVIGSIIDGAFSSWSLFVQYELPILGGELLFEVCQYAVVVALFALVFRRRSTAETENAFPFTGLFRRSNPVQKAALAAGCVIAAVRCVVLHLFYQFFLLVEVGEFEGWLVLTADLIGDVIVGVIAYFVMLLLLQRFDVLAGRSAKTALEE